MPEFFVAFRPHEVPATVVSVPETAVDENYRFIFWKHDIRCSRIPFVVYPVPESLRKKIFPDNHLRFCLLSFYLRHVIASCFFAVYVHIITLTVYFQHCFNCYFSFVEQNNQYFTLLYHCREAHASKTVSSCVNICSGRGNLSLYNSSLFIVNRQKSLSEFFIYAIIHDNRYTFLNGRVKKWIPMWNAGIR